MQMKSLKVPVDLHTELKTEASAAGEKLGELVIRKLRGTMAADKIASGFKESVSHPFTKSNDMDLKFRKALSPEDRAVFDLAKKKRDDILLRFGKIR